MPLKGKEGDGFADELGIGDQVRSDDLHKKLRKSYE